jgi:hypothetical protein
LFHALLDEWLVPGIEHTLFIYLSTPKYDFFDDEMYCEKASTAMGSYLPGLTV